MKRIILSAIFLMVMAISTPVFAQNSPNNDVPEVNVITVSVERIFRTRYGFVVAYFADNTRLAHVVLPHEWFASADKAELINMPRGRSWPSMSVFFENGEFSHVRLHAHRSRQHITWGILPPSPELTQAFQNAETVILEF